MANSRPNARSGAHPGGDRAPTAHQPTPGWAPVGLAGLAISDYLQRMLVQFLTNHRKEIVDLAQAKVAARQAPRPTPEELSAGLPLFVEQLIETLQKESSRASAAAPA